MLINSTYKVEALDDKAVVLLKKITSTDKKTGEKYEAWKAVAYGSTIKEMLISLINREINGTGLKEFYEVVKKVEELKGTIEKLCLDNLDKKLYDELVNKLESEDRPVSITIWEKSNGSKRKKRVKNG